MPHERPFLAKYIPHQAIFDQNHTRKSQINPIPAWGVETPPLRFFAGKNPFLKISTCGLRLNSSLDFLHASAKKNFQKIYSKGVPGGPKNFEKKNFSTFFFQKLLRLV